MRPLLIGIALLALISGLAPAAVAESIQNPTLAFGSVPWEFSTRNNTFSGEQTGGGGSTEGHLTLRAKFDDEGNFKTGTFQYRALDNHLLLQGKLSEPSVDAIPSGIEGINEFYWVRFGLIVHRDDLPFPVDSGEFWAYVCDPRGDCGNEGRDNGPTSLEGVFTTDYTGASAPLNNYLWTSHDDVSADLFFLAAVAVPAPAPGVLLGVGMVMLVAMRLRRLTS
jgi:hypothetical protein